MARFSNDRVRQITFFLKMLKEIFSQIFFVFESTILSVNTDALANGVKSQLRGGQTRSTLRLIMLSSKTGRKTSSVASAVLLVSPSY